ncbi:hypothetical protein Tsubulata_016352 [Turnera subulata]|uniref:glutathione transferase n=1 Tax=Turnera subulata TaxID=218843 RepID=A0A9Q0F4A2_9ROSI|nr:hypothetical protein Tsubulata_016352 [Turnera subulata]
MAAIKLHGNSHSTAVRRVLACLYEKELEFEFVFVDRNIGQHKKEPYLSLQPFGQVPALEDGDLKIFESRAITNYIAKEYGDKGTQLIYTSGTQMAEMLVWMEVEAHQFNPAFSNLKLLVQASRRGSPMSTAVVEECEAKFSKVLDVYEARLGQSEYLAGDGFTLADLHHLPTISYLMATEYKKLFDSLPHVSAWVANITARPAWVKALATKDQQ